MCGTRVSRVPFLLKQMTDQSGTRGVDITIVLVRYGGLGVFGGAASSVHLDGANTTRTTDPRHRRHL